MKRLILVGLLALFVKPSSAQPFTDTCRSLLLTSIKATQAFGPWVPRHVVPTGVISVHAGVPVSTTFQPVTFEERQEWGDKIDAAFQQAVLHLSPRARETAMRMYFDGENVHFQDLPDNTISQFRIHQRSVIRTHSVKHHNRGLSLSNLPRLQINDNLADTQILTSIFMACDVLGLVARQQLFYDTDDEEPLDGPALLRWVDMLVVTLQQAFFARVPKAVILADIMDGIGNPTVRQGMLNTYNYLTTTRLEQLIVDRFRGKVPLPNEEFGAFLDFRFQVLDQLQNGTTP